MRVIDVLRRLVHNSDSSAKSLAEAVALLDRTFSEVTAGIADHADLMNRRLVETVAGIINQSELINRRSAEMVEGIANQSAMIQQKLSEAVDGIAGQSDLINRKVAELAQTVDRLSSKVDSLIELQKAEIVMQRDQAEAIDELAKVLKGALPKANDGPFSARPTE